MAQVTLSARLTNYFDLHEVRAGHRRSEEVRQLELTNALVDTRSLFLSLPRGHIEQLALQHFGTRKARLLGGIVSVNVFGIVVLAIQGRDCRLEVVEAPEGSPALIGRIALDSLDLVVDPINQCLIGNPAHGGEEMFDLFWTLLTGRQHCDS